MSNKRSGRRKEMHPEGRLRDEILRQLERVERGAWVDRLAPAVVFSADDRRRITEYIGGITRRRRWLDFVIDSYSARAGTIDPVIRHVLRIGTYELTELQRAPHAAVFASVEQAKRLGRMGVGSFVNGVLRSMARDLNHLPEPKSGDDVVDSAILYSHPDWMARRWVERFGIDGARKLMIYNNRRPVHCLRVNTLKTTISDFKRTLDDIEVGWADSPYLPEFLRVTTLQPVMAAGLLRSGIAAVQDESAGLIGRVLRPQPGEFIIDACAAPGGKLVHAGILMENRGRLVGVDVNGKRLESGLAVAGRHGLSIVEGIQADLRTLTPTDSLPEADAVLLDAPCSGLGVLTRRPDLRWRRTEESLVETTALQDQLLDAVARFVKPGGRLVYATCTIEPEENEVRVDAFVRRHPEFALDSASGDLPPSVESEGCMVTLPHVHEIDGAFAARLVRC